MKVQFTKDRTDNWKSYFPVRNGIKPETFLKEGKNYTNETLYYMSKARIARTITDKTESYLNDSQYFVIDMTAGIGGNTIEFLSRKKCSAVMSFERDPERRLMLQRNIQGYQLDDKAIVVNGENHKDILGITGDEDFSAYNSAVFFFDPPWLPQDYKYAVRDDYKKHYIKKDAKVGNLTLEQWLEKLKDTAYMVIYRMPPEYYLNSVVGWTYIVDDLGNDGRLITCIPNSYIKGVDENSEGEVINTSSENFKGLSGLMMKLKPINQDLAKQYETFRNSCNALSVDKAKKEDKCKIFVKWGFTEPQNDKMLAKLPVNPVQIKKEEYETKEERVLVKKPTRVEKINGINFIDDSEDIPLSEQVISVKGAPTLPKNIIDKDSAEWVAEFQSYIKWLLSLFLKGSKGEEIINSLLEPKPMLRWIQAFTEETFIPDKRYNYDLLEIIGDRATEYAFTKILIDKIFSFILKDEKDLPFELTSSVITNLKKEYMSETWQTLTGKVLGFKDWIRIIGPIDDKKYEDVLESFIGALAENGDEIRGKGFGVNLCCKFIDFITSEVKYRTSLVNGDPQTQFRQRLERFFGGNQFQGKTNPNIKYDSLGSPPNIVVHLKVSKMVIEKLSKNGFVLPENGVLGIGKGNSLAIAEKDAANNANKFLDAIGLTNEVVSKKSSERKWEDIQRENPKLADQVKKKIKREGYTDEEFETENKKRGGLNVVILTAVDAKGTVVRIGEGLDKDKFQAKIKALQDYLEK